MTRSKIALITLCALVAIYAGCCRSWWITDSWIITTLAALGWGSDKDICKLYTE